MLDQSGQFGFQNWRSAMWWIGREVFDPASGVDVCIPDEEMLQGDLSAPAYTVTSAARYQVEGKDSLRKRLSRSPDSADAFLMGISAQVLWHERQQKEGERRIVYDPVRIR
jgi:hypothetical protein